MSFFSLLKNFIGKKRTETLQTPTSVSPLPEAQPPPNAQPQDLKSNPMDPTHVWTKSLKNHVLDLEQKLKSDRFRAAMHPNNKITEEELHEALSGMFVNPEGNDVYRESK